MGGYTGATLPDGALYGTGLGTGSRAATAAGTAALPDARQGLASGLLNTAAQVNTALGLAVLVTIATARTARLGGGADALVDGFRWAFVANAALAVAAAAVVGSRPWPLRRAPS